MQRLRKRKYMLGYLGLLVASLNLGGCDLDLGELLGVNHTIEKAKDAVEDVTKQVHVILDDLNNKLGAQSDNWQGTIKDAIDKLGKISGTLPQQIGTQLQQALDRGAAAIGANLGCSTEQLGLELRRFVGELAKQLDTDGPPKPEPVLEPVLCVSSPNAIQLPIVQLSIHFGGFNLDKGTHAAFYKPSGGQEQDISQNLFLTSPHELLLQLGQSGFALPAGDGVVILRLNGKDAATLPVSKIPPPPPVPNCETTSLSETPNSTVIRASTIVNGDGDLGTGSRHSIQFSVQLAFAGRELYALTSTLVSEQGGDFSWFVGWKKELIYTAPYGKRIVDIGLDGNDFYFQNIDLATQDKATLPGAGFINSVEVYLNQPGNDLGYAGFQANFSKLSITLEEDDKVVSCKRQSPRNGLLIISAFAPGGLIGTIEAPTGTVLFPPVKFNNCGIRAVQLLGTQQAMARSYESLAFKFKPSAWTICPGTVSGVVNDHLGCAVTIDEDQVVEAFVKFEAEAKP